MSEQAGQRDAAQAELEQRIEEWKREFGEVAIFRTRLGTIVARPPEQSVYERFLDKAASDKARDSRAAALRELAQLSVVHPSLDEVRAIFKRLPALPGMVGNRCVEMAGGEYEGEVLKA